MKIKVKDGKGKRICTEIKRPDPAAVLVFDEGEEVDVTNAELHMLVQCGYVNLKDVELLGDHTGKIVTAVYPDAICFDGLAPKEPKETVAETPVEHELGDPTPTPEE